ncbi:MAG: hypothetical protein QFE16_05995 [Pseudomonadota bacterium]|nr:hypothetical protein [Pseudomonadota bacterium]
MSTIRSHALLAFCLSIASVGAYAESPASPAAEQRFDNRQDRQEKRIENGVSSGALTQPEARRVGREQARLTRAETRAEADGTVTRKESAVLEKRQDQASRHIFRAKHDAQTRKP